MSKNKLKEIKEQTEELVKKTNQKIDELGSHSNILYEKLESIQGQFDAIRNAPSEKRMQYEKLKKVRLDWKQQVDKIEERFNETAVKNFGGGAAGIGAGVAVAALGPSAAMGIATTFGVASTGTAISALSGAAATNAALAWLGGGTLALGGGGMAAGNAFLALAGPVGWAIAGVALIGSGLLFWKAKDEKDRLENVFTLIGKRDVTSYQQAIVEINERIERIEDESKLLAKAIGRIQTFGIDYDQMSEAQQYELGAYFNLMESSTNLLVNPIQGLQPKYTEEDFKKFIFNMTWADSEYYRKNKNILIVLANQFYKVPLDETDKSLLVKNFKNNKDFLSAMSMEKSDFDIELMQAVEKCLSYKARS
ncbi:hypothetical protein ABHC48_15375 [Ruminococcus sp. 1001136sp1]|uniref:hypothetical protein n=1 Tax=unclassified Ruminococcus TaxID=2608920 RepID=UPI00189E1F51|nr:MULTISPECIES: hypothetical protein [unclassified Ruminococcus]MDB8773252.1 hypothetical protein [Ruminococcus sp. 1001136sp1]MDB8784626.1 hypothetical protein [Ruminococcus sp. 1001136sp1]